MAPNPNYSPHLRFAPTFRWGGREWGFNDAAAFRRKMGKRYASWARKHPDAARVFDPVEQETYAYVQPQITGIEAERKRTADMFARRMQNLGGFYAAIAPLLGGIGPAIGGVYNQGADTMRSAGTGYGAVLNRDMATNAAGANALLSTIGAPEGQNLQGGDAGSVLAGMAGWIPATMMGEQGAAYAEAASHLPKTAALQAQVMMKNLMGEAGEADESFSSEILKIMQGVPSVRAEARDARMQQALAMQKFRLDQLDAERDFWLKKQALALQKKDARLAAQAEKRLRSIEQRYRFESAGRDAWGNPMPGYTEGPGGTLIPPGYKVDKNGNVVKQYAPSRGSKGGGDFTPGQQQDMIETIDKQAEPIKDMIVKLVKAGEWTPSSGRPDLRAKLGRKVFEEFKHLAPTPATKKRLRRIIARVLAEATKIGPPVSGNTGTGGFFD